MKYIFKINNQLLKDIGLYTGTYNVVTNIFINILGNYNTKLYISEISPSRTEIRVRPPINGDYLFFQNWLNFKDIQDKTLKYKINFGNNKVYLINNWVFDKNNPYNDGQGSYILKLYEPLDKSYNIKDSLWISKIVSNPIIISTNIINDNIIVEDDRLYTLKGPNLNIKQLSSNFNVNVTNNKIYDKNIESLIDSNYKDLNNLIIKNSLSSSIFGNTELDIDYSDYNNFIHFSSATERLNNFYNKMYTLEYYHSQSNWLYQATQSSEVINNINILQNKINNTINTLDGYEKYMYYNSSSNYIDTYGTHSSYTWPKSGTYPNYNNLTIYYPSSSIYLQNWYITQSLIAEDYDKQNIHNLNRLTPQYILNDDYNDEYIKFVNVVGHYYDIINNYIEYIPQCINGRDSYIQNNHINYKNIVFELLKSQGINVTDNNNIVNLYNYNTVFDKNYNILNKSNNIFTLSGEQLTQEIWLRILNNIIYILKSKGTKNSIKALLNCYGIPSSLIEIKEYGGGCLNNEFIIDSHPYQEFNDFIFGLDIKNNVSKVKGNWSYNNSDFPEAIELRFRHAYPINNSIVTSNYSESIFSTYDSGLTTSKLKLYTEYSGSNWGYLKFNYDTSDTDKVITSSLLPLYNGKFWNIMITSKSEGLYLYTNQSDQGLIVYSSSTYLPSSSISSIKWCNNDEDIFYIGNSIEDTVSGSFQEFRLWNTSPSKEDFDSHTKYLKSIYNSNDEVINSLNTRYTFNNPNNLTVITNIDDSKPNQTDNINNGIASGFSNSTIFPHQYSIYHEVQNTYTPNIGLNINNNKIRLIDNYLSSGSNLSLNTTNDEFIKNIDNVILDSNRVSIYFSPTNLLDKNIIQYYNNYNFDNLIGDPRDQWEGNYNDLQNENNRYWYELGQIGKINNYIDYIKLIRYYDKSLFDLLKESILPARVNSEVGFYIKPSIMERSKMKLKPIQKIEYKINPTPPINICDSISCIGKNNYKTSDNINIYNNISLTNSDVNNNLNTKVVCDLNFINSKMVIFKSNNIDGTVKSTINSKIIDMVNPTCNLDNIYSREPNISTISAKNIFNPYSYRFYRFEPTGVKHMKYGTLQTKDTTLDKKEPIEVIFTNPNKLIVNDKGIGVKLKVI